MNIGRAHRVPRWLSAIWLSATLISADSLAISDSIDGRLMRLHVTSQTTWPVDTNDFVEGVIPTGTQIVIGPIVDRTSGNPVAGGSC